jgi:hypothetical protein
MVVGPAEVGATRIAEVAGRTTRATGSAEVAGRTTRTAGTAWPAEVTLWRTAWPAVFRRTTGSAEVTLRGTTGSAVLRRTTRTALWRRAAAWTTGATLDSGGRVARCRVRNA